MSLTHLHLLLNHFPVIGTVIGLGLLSFAALRKNADLTKASLGLFAVLALISVVVYLTGEPAEEAVENLPGFSESIVERHEDFALFATIALSSAGAAALAVLALFRGRVVPRWIQVGSVIVAFIVTGAMGYTAMLGGEVRHTEIRNEAPLISPGSRD